MLNRLPLLITLTLLALGYAGPSAAQSAPPAQIAKGQRLFLRCQSCHEIADTKVVKSGPVLKGVFGRKVASQDGYPYSADLKAQSFTWDEAHLDQWLEQPTAVAPGTSMAFIGLPSPEDRKALIAYLKSAQ